ncbi:MAG: hypothetical protein V7K25_21755 [Nostoc sp.]
MAFSGYSEQEYRGEIYQKVMESERVSQRGFTDGKKPEFEPLKFQLSCANLFTLALLSISE